MFCVKCGSQLIEGDAYCRTCGMPINRFLTPQMPFAQPEKIVLKSSWTKFLAYISTIVAYFLSGSFFGIGFLVPFAWFIYFCLYISDKDKAKYDVSYFVKLRNEFIVLSLLGLPIIKFL